LTKGRAGKVNWIIRNWKSLAGLGVTVPTIFAATGWILNRIKTRREKNVHAAILEALGNPSLWKGAGVTGAGAPVVKAKALAAFLKLDHDRVADALEELESAGKVKSTSGSMDDPSPGWFIRLR
jgi:hypothetical protein